MLNDLDFEAIQDALDEARETISRADLVNEKAEDVVTAAVDLVEALREGLAELIHELRSS